MRLEHADRMSAPVLSTSRRLGRMAFAVVLLLGTTSVFTFATPSPTSAWNGGSFSSASEAELVTLTNRSRASAGLRALIVDSALTSVARWRSKDMIDRDYFSHDIPGYGKVWDKLHAIGYCYKGAGENIGWNNYPDDVATAAVHQAFMDSSGHRANILGAAWDHIGIGAYKGPTGKKMWTVLFADKCGTTATAKPTPRPTAKPTPRPTAKPAAKPVVVTAPAPIPTATPSPFEVVFVPLSNNPVSTPTGIAIATPTASQEAPVGTDGRGAVAMRVVDHETTGGLLETIVGGVTVLFFGG